MTKARKYLLVSLLFLFASAALYVNIIPSLSVRASVSPTPIGSMSADDTIIEGVWDQFVIVNGSREFLARLDLRADGSDYVAVPFCLADSAYPRHSYRSFEHYKENSVWMFSEDWDGEIGQFVLERQANGEYVGYATSSDNGRYFKTIFVPVCD